MASDTTAVPAGPSHREPDDAILATQDVRCTFGGVHAVDGVSINVTRGLLTGLIGPNGAGKSTLLSALAGTVTPASGRIVFEGADVTGLRPYARAQAGLIRTFQLSSEFKRMTVLENLLTAAPGNPGDSLAGSLFRRRRWRHFDQAALGRAADLLTRFGLRAQADDYAGDLSGGQRRLVEIMRSLMASPRVLLLDEPMAGVHPRLAGQIGDLLRSLCQDGTTILMVEHELGLVGRLCDTVIVMAEGRVLAEGTMAELRQRAEVVDAYLAG